MSKIDLSQEDYDFLKDLCHELNTQTNDGNAQPVYWGIMEKHEVLAPEGCGRPKIRHDDGAWEFDEAIEHVNECISDYDQDIQSEWAELDKDFPDDVCEFMQEGLKWDFCDLYWAEDEDVLCKFAGAFLTKRAAKEYVEKYGYNHNQPRTYAMTAFRNFELERLLKILKNINFDENEKA